MGRRRWEWWVMLALAAAVVYPDKILERLAMRTGREYGWRSSALIAGAAALGLAWFTFFLIPRYPRVYWWSPLLVVGILGAVRFLVGWIKEILGTDRW